MRDDSTRQCVLFPELFGKPLVARFDQPHGSSDGGAVLLKACDERLRLTERLAACFRDERQPGKVMHTLHDLIGQRVFAIACGYADCNDAARLADDPIQKLLVGRDPLEGEALASQATLSRFENAAGPKVLYRMGEALADAVIERQRRHRRGKAKRITVELDPTDDPTHGTQQLTLFNGHYDTWCYLPVAGFIRFDEEPEQYLFAYVLRPGNAPAKLGAIGILKRVLARLRAAFPKARLRVRLDGGYACPEILDFLDTERVQYVVAMAGNAVLERACEPWMKRARRASASSKQTTHLYAECRYAAKSWGAQRRIIIKAEVVRLEGREPRDNARYVITNLSAAPQRVYEDIYCQRAEIENRIKELHHGLEIDRTSCTRFWANQLRVLLTAAAYVLMQELRGCAATTDCARAQVSTLRERLLKLGVWVQRSVRRIVLHLPQYAPWRSDWCRVARCLGAVPS
ncbi:MAG TPA: IS1380 family transposase [Gemmatimonadaceae bacterium]|nr:IS1380 family transposase [Gemmatimonadaceae bacterium]